MKTPKSNRRKFTRSQLRRVDKNVRKAILAKQGKRSWWRKGDSK
jgi:hypothetical protein